MRQARGSLTFRTGGPGLREVTAEIEAWLGGQSIDTGLLTLFIRHTSASLLIQENADPDVLRDLEDFFARLAPHAEAAYRHRAEGPDDMPAHIRGGPDPEPTLDPGERRGDGARDMAGDLPFRAPRRAASPRAAPTLDR